MTTKPLPLSRLSMLCVTTLLSTGLLLSGCSNNDTVEADNVGTENTDTVSTSDDAAATGTTDDTTQTDVIETDNMDSVAVTDSGTEQATANGDEPLTATSKQKSLVTNPTQAGTPEDTVKQALDSLYYGDVKQAATYYKVDMANFEQELAKTQSAFQQTVDGVTITDTNYNDDKTRATIVGELMLKGQSDPAPLTYELQKIGGQWKILG
ncbi:hypothetical protein AAJP47_02865 [Psychrobacter sp. B38]|uniref:hypothetical protein n=1 Tax=Psychrobacter sp. B38 TaxID=3143538 RepID=UPI00320D5BCC